MGETEKKRTERVLLLVAAWVLGYRHRGALLVVKFLPADAAGTRIWRREPLVRDAARIERAMVQDRVNYFNCPSRPLMVILQASETIRVLVGSCGVVFWSCKWWSTESTFS